MRLHLIAAVTAAALATAACGTSSTPATPETQTATVTSTPAQPSITTTTQETTPTACDQLNGTVAGDTCTVSEKQPDYTVDIKFPADYPDGQAVVDLMNTQRDGFLDLISDRPGPENPYALDITGTEYRSGDPESGTVGVVFEEYSNVGGAHPETSYDSLSYDLATDTPITIDTLFKPGTDPATTLDPIITADFEKLLDGAEIPPNPSGLDMYKAFALTDDAVIFFIGQGAWAFGAAGAQQFSVPRVDLAGILA